MDTRRSSSIEVNLTPSGYTECRTFLDSFFQRHNIPDKTATETWLIVKSLLQHLAEQGIDSQTPITVTGRFVLRRVELRIGFEGERVEVAHVGTQDETSHAQFLSSFDDRVTYTYSHGYNIVDIVVQRSYRTSRLLPYGLGFLVALGLYTIMRAFLDRPVLYALNTDYVMPLETVFTGAVLMIGAPVTFLSLLRNLSDTFIIAQKSSSARRLRVKSIASSCVAILLASVTAALANIPLAGLAGYESAYAGDFTSLSFREFMESILPTGIFSAFEALSPFPLIIFTMLVSYTLRYTGAHFETLRAGIEALYTLCSQMLRVVMAALPLFCCIGFMDVLLESDYSGLVDFLLYVAICAMSLVVLAVYYAVRLRVNGIAVLPFVKRLGPLLLENLRINSAIDAVPFNVRYCTKVFGMRREHLTENMSVLAQINLDGNCYLILFITSFIVTLSGTNVDVADVCVICLTVLFLSLGAPNQPGSVLIGLAVMTQYLHLHDMVGTVILSEVLFGSILNLVNVVGDVVTVAIEDKRQQELAVER